MAGKINKYIIGIDEAGRGSLAGPVVVAGIRIELRSKNQEVRIFRDIRDSKKLTAKRREEWYRILTNHPKIKWAAAVVSPQVIDRINISRAADLGALRVYKRLNLDGKRFSLGRKIFAVLDGGLKLSSHVPHEAIIKGDEKIPVISAASIIAKVTRDRIMTSLHKKYPEYGFDVHKGYGTSFHQKMIKKLGRCEIHRKSFRFA